MNSLAMELKSQIEGIGGLSAIALEHTALDSLAMELKSQVEGIGGLSAIALGDTNIVWRTYTWVSPIVDLLPGIKLELSLGVTHYRFSPYILDDIMLSVTFIPEKQEDWSRFGFFLNPGKRHVYGFSLFQQLNLDARQLFWGGREYREGEQFSSIIPNTDKQEQIKEKVREILGEHIRNILDVNKLFYETIKGAYYKGNPEDKLNFSRYQKIALKRLKIH